MDQQYLVLELEHPERGHPKRIQISRKALVYVSCAFLLFAAVVVGLSFRYLQMCWQVSRFNQLQANFDYLRARYQDLKRTSDQDSDQMASLETLASEISVAYGINPPASSETSQPLETDSSLKPTVKESIEEFNFLKAASYSGIGRRYAFQWQVHREPSRWPVNGVLRSSFGERNDPFTGEGAFHTGVDLAVPKGTPVHVTADGVVQNAGWSGGYGKLIIVNHGNGLETYYAHLSQFLVVPGEAVRRGQVIGFSGGTGHATGPHVHYEVRLNGTPVNPYKYMARLQRMAAVPAAHNDLGL